MAAQSPSNKRDHQYEVTESTEQTPLISKTLGVKEYGRTSSIASQAITVSTTRKPSRVVAILCVIVFVASAAGGFQNMSMTRIFEDTLCRKYYSGISSHEGPIDESMCKVDAIQSELAYLFATMSALSAGVSILTALPWGIVADRLGRRPVFALALFGMSFSILWIMIVGWFHQTLSPQLIWLAPISYLLGGGNPVLSATIASIATDVVPESERSVSFLRLHGASMVGNLISPALASILMASTGPWVPLFVAFILTALPAPAIFLVPESLKHVEEDDDCDKSDANMVKTRLAQSLEELRKSARVFNSPSMLMILLITMMQLAVHQCTYQFLSQFTSKRYDIPLAETGYIQSIYGMTYVAVSFFIMPFISSSLLKPGASAPLRFDDDKRRDLFLTRSSYIAAMVGTLILGLSPSLSGFVFGLVVLAFGVAGEGFLKNIATRFVSAEKRTRLFTILSLSAIAGDLWVSPALAKLFTTGMRIGGTWIGLPYLGVSFLCVLMFLMSLLIRVPQSYRADEASDSEEGLSDAVERLNGAVEGLLGGMEG